jgi:hypothetical protein
MKWSMQLRTDAVLTNDPKKYLAVRESHVPSTADCPENWPWRDRLRLFMYSWLGYLMMTFRVWRYSGHGAWKERLGNVEERLVEGGISEKMADIE